jgi:hypothetical protein
MEELVAAHDAVFRPVPEHQSLDPLEILIAVERPRFGGHKLPRHGFGLHHARPGIGMSGQPVRHAAFAQSVDARQRGKKARHAGRIVARARSVLDAKAIRFELRFPAVPQEQHAQTGGTQIGKRRGARHEDAEDREADAGLRLPRVGLGGMARGDVANLMTEHAR